MSKPQSFVDRLRPHIGHRPRGEQLYLAALLESGAAARYREWAGEMADPEVAACLRECAVREETIAAEVHKHFAGEIVEPKDMGELMGVVQKEVAALFGGLTIEQQLDAQAAAERGGEQLWLELAAAESDSERKEVFEECARLEAASAAYLEQRPR